MGYFVLNGGLGNQLFQFAAALHQFPNEPINVVTGLGNPRCSNEKLPDLFGFELNDFVNIINIKPRVFPSLLSKINNYLLRVNAEERNYCLRLLEVIYSLTLSVVTKKHFRISYCSGVGFSERHPNKHSNTICGYFQSYKYMTGNTFEKIITLQPVNISDALVLLSTKAKLERPIMIHLRLGDYLLSPEFGVPGPDYYLEGLKECLKANPNSPIWLFTNDEEYAKSYLPHDLIEQIDFIPGSLHSPAEDLELLRYGSGYVIGNSTFSWWGAFLRYDSEAIVVSPTPWYSRMKEPKFLIPDDWLPLSSNFRQ
jgi:hypothetical protein